MQAEFLYSTPEYRVLFFDCNMQVDPGIFASDGGFDCPAISDRPHTCLIRVERERAQRCAIRLKQAGDHGSVRVGQTAIAEVEAALAGDYLLVDRVAPVGRHRGVRL